MSYVSKRVVASFGPLIVKRAVPSKSLHSKGIYAYRSACYKATYDKLYRNRSTWFKRHLKALKTN